MNTVAVRFEVSDKECGMIECYSQLAVALDAALIHNRRERHDAIVFDKMARKGQAETWSDCGHVLGRR